ncbi:MAG: 4Fe-4S dicluster domain-containing protein [Candidatus Bathyarchaeota archaeon]|nr:MAG: 4Fe-4S dicluster domain-containing protein [Candidatus Bathyarchaeota archaeon]
MTEAEQSMRKTARKLLEEKKVAMIIGYEKGTLPLRTTPCFISDTKEVDRLVWNATCANNLAKYIIDSKGKVGIIAKGCDARSIVTCIVEKQIDRENVFIIGLPCAGIIDRKKIETELDEQEILEAKINDDHIILKGENFERQFAVKSIIDDSCLSCKYRNPPIYDVLVGEKVPDSMGDDKFISASRNESKSDEERWELFTKELNKCIRCYACKNVCPLCYCNECFVDQNMPTWLGKTDNPSDTMVYHIIRILHTAGRCVDCGTCSRACPMGINLRALTQKMVKLVKELYGFDAGLSIEDVPPLATFKQDDPQEFIQ